MNTIDGVLVLIGGGIFLGGMAAGALLVLGWALMASRSRDAEWEVRRGR